MYRLIMGWEKSYSVAAALYISIVLGNLINPEESMIMSCDMEVKLRGFERLREASTSLNRGTQWNIGVRRSGIIERYSAREKAAVHGVVLMFNGVEDLKGFKVKQLVPRGSLEELKGFQLCCGSTVLRIEGSSSVAPQTQASPNCILRCCIKDDCQEKVNITFYSCQYQNPNCHLMTV
ncbi:hypothetical protein M9H77_02294 [Catharanthus roseus]|uniref:Uncharacterized protein n=1 Tax=Catharanthus roseus TaxID=4058 RepID=A0ACC0C7Z8_CATRO|nr:hypothetical protein M9H77_02294 [Catharanthus roseus]